MLPPTLPEALRASFPHLPDPVPVGEGDYCQAFLVDHIWLILLAKHLFASECLDRVARVLPRLADASPIPLPRPAHHGRVEGLAYIGYRRLPGTELTAERFAALTPEQRQALAGTLGEFFRHLHAFDPAEAVRLGVPVSEYPFAMQEEGLRLGSAEELYREDVAAFAAWPGARAEVVAGVERALDAHLRSVGTPAHTLVLLHGEVSGDHVLHDPQTGKPTGIIDLNGMIVGRPARDFLYLYGEYGAEFVADVLRAYRRLPPGEVLEELQFLQLWHVLARLLWAAEHGYAARANTLQEQLVARLATPS